MKCLRYKLRILWYGIRVDFSLKEELKPNFLLSCFVKLAPSHKWGDKFWHTLAWYQTHMQSHAMQRLACFSDGNSVSIYPNLKLISFRSYHAYMHQLPKFISIPWDENMCLCVTQRRHCKLSPHFYMIQQVMRHPLFLCVSLHVGFLIK